MTDLTERLIALRGWMQGNLTDWPARTFEPIDQAIDRLTDQARALEGLLTALDHMAQERELSDEVHYAREVARGVHAGQSLHALETLVLPQPPARLTELEAKNARLREALSKAVGLLNDPAPTAVTRPEPMPTDQDPELACTCEPTGECRVAMSGPTCWDPDCPPCQTPELDRDPDCPVCGTPEGTSEAPKSGDGVERAG